MRSLIFFAHSSGLMSPIQTNGCTRPVVNCIKSNVQISIVNFNQDSSPGYIPYNTLKDYLGTFLLAHFFFHFRDSIHLSISSCLLRFEQSSL